MFHYEVIDLSTSTFPFKLLIHQQEQAIIPNHWHNALEISYTSYGSIDQFTIGHKNYCTKAGDILIINPTEVHRIITKHASSKITLALSIIIPIDWLQPYIPDISSRVYTIPELKQQTNRQKKSYQRMQQILEDLIITKQKIKKPYEALHIYSLVYQLLFELTEYFSSIDNHYYHAVQNEDIPWVQEVLTYIKEHLEEELSVSYLAQQFHLSPSYFSKKFKRYTQMTVLEYIYQLRLQKAYHYVVHTNKSMQYISDFCGFPNIKTFYRVFKKKIFLPTLSI